MPLIVRKATVVDASALAALRLEALAETRGRTEPDSGSFVEFFCSWVSDHLSTHVAFLAEADGAVVGMAWLMVAERVPSPERWARRSGDVQSVYVVANRRDVGIGAALLEAVLVEAVRLELEHVTVHANDRALTLYERVGFGYDERWLRWLPE